MKDRKTMIVIIITLIISIIGLGIAFAAFSQTLTINGNATVEATNWEIVFEGTDGTSTLGAPTLTGRASVVTAPTIKNNQTEISNYSVTLQAPGDSITYNFKVHNKGSFAANLGSLTISGVNKPASPVTGSALVTDSSIATQNASTLAVIEYKLYYTDNDQLVGQDEKDCLDPGESENLSLKITFASPSATDTSILPSSNLILDNLGITAVYNQANVGSCAEEQDPTPPTPTGDPFVNTDGAYYTYEGKSFIGTGVNNLILAEYIIDEALYSSGSGVNNGDGTYTFADHPAADVAAAYCTGCRIMTKAEAESWGCSDSTFNTKCVGNYNGNSITWWLADAYSTDFAWSLYYMGNIDLDMVTVSYGVRPVVSVPAGSTMTGSGTQGQPYVITVN